MYKNLMNYVMWKNLYIDVTVKMDGISADFDMCMYRLELV